MSFFRKKYAWAILYTTILTAFTAYVALDTFVIARVYTGSPSGSGGSANSVSETASSPQGNGNDEPISSESNSISPNSSAGMPDLSESDSTSSGTASNASALFTDEVIVTDTSYSDQNISITITEHREYDTTIYVADVYVSSPEYLKTAFAENAYGRNIKATTSEIAEENGAILAINGDYYGSQEKGYVLRNGILYRDTASGNQENLVIWADGSFEITAEGEASASQLLEKGAQQVLSFGPALVVDGTNTVSVDDEVGKAKASNPRTAIGIVDELHYLFVVSDGRTGESSGLSLSQLAEFLQSLGVETAYNLDGGGSSTMYFNGAVVNNPTTNGKSIKERSVSDIVYIG